MLSCCMSGGSIPSSWGRKQGQTLSGTVIVAAARRVPISQASCRLLPQLSPTLTPAQKASPAPTVPLM